MNSTKKSSEMVDEVKAELTYIHIEIGEGRALDDKLLQLLKERVLSSTVLVPNELEFFLNILNQTDIHISEDWELIKFIKIANKTNIKITLLGKPRLIIESSEKSTIQLIKLLKHSYSTGKNSKLNKVLQDENSPDDIRDAYINLALVCNQSDGSAIKEMKDSSFNDNRMMNAHEHIYGKKKSIKLKHLFLSSETEHNVLKGSTIASKVLVEGWAGIGKTVLCQYLSYVWAKNQCADDNRWWLSDTQIVIYICLRNLTNYDSVNCRLGEVVRRECLGVKDSNDTNYPSAAQIEADLEILGDKVILVLDGFDEVADWYNELDKGKKQCLSSRAELLQNVLINNPNKYRVIVASRPYRISQILNIIDRRFETIGFTDENIERYINNYFTRKSNLGEELLQNIKGNVNLWGIAHIPVNLALLCLICWKGGTQIKSLKSITELYKEVILWLLRRDWQKHPVIIPKRDKAQKHRLAELGVAKKSLEIQDSDKLSQDALELNMETFEREIDPYAKKIQLLKTLAWHGQISDHHDLLISGMLVGEKLNIHYEAQLTDREQKEILDAIKTLGLLESQYNENTLLVTKNNYYFPHLTFQEFFAAKYWVSLFSDSKFKKLSIILLRKYKYNPRFEMTWAFVSGLLVEKSSELNEFFTLIGEAPRDLANIYHTSLEMRCLNECQLKVDGIIIDRAISFVCTLIDRICKINGNILFRKTLFTQLGQSPYIYDCDQIVNRIRCNLNDLDTQFRMLEILTISIRIPDSLIRDITGLFTNSSQPESRFLIEILSKPLNSTKTVIDTLLALLDNPTTDSETLGSVLDVLSNQSILTDKVREIILSFLDHKDPLLRKKSIHIISSKKSIFMVDAYTFSKHIRDPDVRFDAIYALTELNNLPDDLLENMSELLADTDQDIRKLVVMLLRRSTNLSQQIISKILKLLNRRRDVSIHLDIWRVLSLQVNLPESAIDIILSYFNHSDPVMKLIPLEFLDDHQELLVVYRSSMVNLLQSKHDDDFFLSIAICIFARNFEATSEEIGLLTELLKHPAPIVRRGAIYALSKQKYWQPDLLTSIKILLKDSDYNNRLFMLSKLGKNLHYLTMCINDVTQLLKDEAFPVRFKTVKILNKVGWSDYSIKLWVNSFKDLDTPYLLESMTFLISWTIISRAVQLFKTEIAEKSQEASQLMCIIIYKSLFERVPIYYDSIFSLHISTFSEIKFDNIVKFNMFTDFFEEAYKTETGVIMGNVVETRLITPIRNRAAFLQPPDVQKSEYSKDQHVVSTGSKYDY